jgi:hypothetical protein
LFALFQDQIISKQHNSWNYTQTGDKVTKDDIFQWFPNHNQVENLNIFAGTAKFKGKTIYLSVIQHKCKYLNHRMVHFNSSSAFETENPEASESEEGNSKSEDDTAKVNKLLQSVEQAITSAIDKLASLPSTPQLQESLLP